MRNLILFLSATMLCMSATHAQGRTNAEKLLSLETAIETINKQAETLMWELSGEPRKLDKSRSNRYYTKSEICYLSGVIGARVETMSRAAGALEYYPFKFSQYEGKIYGDTVTSEGMVQLVETIQRHAEELQGNCVEKNMLSSVHSVVGSNRKSDISIPETFRKIAEKSSELRGVGRYGKLTMCLEMLRVGEICSDEYAKLTVTLK